MTPQTAPASSSTTTSPFQMTELSSPTEDDETLKFYISTVAPSNVWLDSDGNEYKRSIPHLAKRQPVLMMAIRAVCMRLMGADAALSDEASNTAIIEITQMIKPIVAQTTATHAPHDVDFPDTERLEALLASMLILSNHSLVSSNLAGARSHREAARTIVRCLRAGKARKHALIDFLQNQLAIYEVLACTTLTNVEHIDAAILPEKRDDDVLFGEYIHILHRVTLLSLQRSPSPTIYTRAQIIPDFQRQFELALGSTLLAAGPLIATASKELRQDFIRTAHLYHHAGLLYTCERLRLGRVHEPWPTSAQRLFDILDEFQNITVQLYNLPWPLLIAGIVASENPVWQRKVVDMFEWLTRDSHYEHYADVLAFCQELWADPRRDWLVLAREREESGASIVSV